MDTKEKIIELLGSLIHPETGEDLVKSGFVEQVNASDEHISVALHFAKARDPFAFKLKAQAEALLREAFSAATVTFLSANSTLSAQIDESTNLNDQLRVQRSVLSSNARISRIAAQNYGMVLTADAVTVDLTPEEDAAAADGEAAQTADAAAAESSVS